MAKMFAMLSNQGTAMAETAVCEEHRRNHLLDVARAARAADDWDGKDLLHDVTGNDALECLVCGATSD